MTAKPKLDTPKDTLLNTPALRKSVVITCASMATLVLVSLVQFWRAREMFDAFTGGDIPLTVKLLLGLVAVCMSFTVVGMVGYVIAALPVLARARQRSIERLLSAQALLWWSIGATFAGLFVLAILGKVLNFLSSLWPF